MSAKRESLDVTDGDIARFWSKVDRSNPDGCWPWMAARTPKGYGVFSVGRKNWSAHRFAMQTSLDAPIGNLLVCHECDNPPCCNPAHFFLGTHKDNLQDAANKGRMATGDRHSSKTHPELIRRGDNSPYRMYPERFPRGDDHYSRKLPHLVLRGEAAGRAKLTEPIVVSIRAAAAQGTSFHELAAMHGVTRQAIGFIVRRKSWKHVK